MNAFSKLNTKDKYFIYGALLCLFLTTFPLAQGWIRIGDFIPRALFLMAALFLKPSLFTLKDILLLLLYFAYTVFVAPKSLGIGIVAEMMQFLIPLVLANFLFDKKNSNQSISFGRIAIFASVFIMINNILVNSIHPGIIRAMVEFSAEGEMMEGLKYTRMGVCLYSFAMIAMCLAPVFLYLARSSEGEKIFILYFIIALYFVYIAGITACLLIMAFMITLYYANISKRSIHSIFPASIFTLIVLYLIGFAIIEAVLPLFEGTTFYSRLGGLLAFYGKDNVVSETYDVDGRVDLYRYSIYTFINNPIFGNASGKIGGHNFFLDHFARSGIVGMTPFILFLYSRFKSALRILSTKASIVYIICIIGFLFLGFLKGMNGIDFWTYMFVYIPCILRMDDVSRLKTNTI